MTFFTTPARQTNLYLLCFVLLAACPVVFNACMFETNDDVVFRGMVNGDYFGYHERQLIFPSVIFGTILASLYRLAAVDWYGWVMFGVIVASLLTVLRILLQRYEGTLQKAMAMTSVSLFYIYCSFYMNFTMVAGVAAVAGMMACTPFIERRGRIGQTILGFVLLFIGTIIRLQSTVLIMALYISLMVIWRRRGVLRLLPGILICCLFPVAINLYNSAFLAASPEWKRAQEEQDSHFWFTDQRGLQGKPLPAGWSLADRDVIENFVSDQNPKFSGANLKEIRSQSGAFELRLNRLRQLRNIVFARQLPTGYDPFFTPILILLTAGCFMVISPTERRRYLIFLSVAAVVLVSIVLFLKMEFRVYFTIAASAILFPLGLVQIIDVRDRRRNWALVCYALAGVLLIPALFLNLRSARKMVAHFSERVSLLEAHTKQLQRDAVVIQADYSWSFADMPALNGKAGPGLYERFFFQGWLTGRPPNTEKGRKLGILDSNDRFLYEVSVDNPKIYFLSNEVHSAIIGRYITAGQGKAVVPKLVHPVADSVGFYQFVTAGK